MRAREHSRRKGRDTWVPPGESVTVQGRYLADGMVYVGYELRGASPNVAIDPALINPRLRVNNRFPDNTGQMMGYWPSYSTITPASRAAFLDWLAAGRPNGAYIGYVFLFFYGIERRILFDLDHDDIPNTETEILIEEVERLLDLYGNNNSFNSYVGEFLSLVKCLRIGSDFSLLKPPFSGKSWELPLELKLGLGSLVASGKPLPASWALSWLRLHPEVSLRTPAIRCPDEFNNLFEARYHLTYGPGMKVPRNKTPLRYSYRPASASFIQPIDIKVGELPDVGRLKRPVRLLRELGESVCNELDQYSRWVGRHGDSESLGAVALLPPEIASKRQSAELSDLLEKIESALGGRDFATMPVMELVTKEPLNNVIQVTYNSSWGVSETLEPHMGFFRCSQGSVRGSKSPQPGRGRYHASSLGAPRPYEAAR